MGNNGGQTFRFNAFIAFIAFIAIAAAFIASEAAAQTDASGQTGQPGHITGDFEMFQNFFFLDSNLLSTPIPPQY